MTTVLTIQNLAKCYRVQASTGPRAAHGYRTLREDLMDWMKAPLRWLRNAAAAPAEQDFWALQDISFDVNKGEVVGIIGDRKSTRLNSSHFQVSRMPSSA